MERLRFLPQDYEEINQEGCFVCSNRGAYANQRNLRMSVTFTFYLRTCIRLPLVDENAVIYRYISIHLYTMHRYTLFYIARVAL